MNFLKAVKHRKIYRLTKYVFSKRGAEGETLKMKIYEYHFKILSERPSKNVDLENRVRQRIFIYGLTYLNKFSAPARSISSLLISMLSLLRLDWSLPRHVAALGSEPWKKYLKNQLVFMIDLVLVVYALEIDKNVVVLKYIF